MSTSAGSIEADRYGYYGRSPVKPPDWSDKIPTYIFTGGFAGASSLLAFPARLRGNDALARPLLYGAAAGAMVSTYCLIMDLGRPERFMNMLRVFKPTSPMNMGVYIFSVYSSAAMLAAAADATGVARPVGRACEGVAALVGPAMATYTGVLIADTAVPTWNEGRVTIPSLFAATSAAAAGAWGMLFAPPQRADAARRFAVFGAVGALIASKRLHAEVGPILKESFKAKEAVKLGRSATVLAFSGTACALLAKKSRFFGVVAGALLFTGALAEKFSVYRAGYISAKDPKYAVTLQRQRIDARGGEPTRLREPSHDGRPAGSVSA
ncbi:MAG: polysulfide reductase NrfD [Candidatus Eremiobacteraeota bacterium]|nr:polysulfide reductase NrfD [Candidatus Eremiobacteraeota bacterium]MBC5804566.1 polysulfide reductase NrfD [Candidatus Eremiobacteraeota bacterium]MBC5821957.1 polysulfide reductase NrfD [Candidatus Eremiobacteraeota bacterium]